MQNTNANTQQLSDADLEMFLMLNGLVVSITGVPIASLSEDNREEIVTKCVDYFTLWIENFMEKHYGKKDAIRIKVSHSSNNSTDVFKKFEDLGDKFDVAWEAFFTEMGTKWEAEKQKALQQ